MTLHSGSCHCGAVAYQVETALDSVIECNCSRCFRTGVWLTFVEADAFTLKQGDDAQTEYRFNSRKIAHQFCRTCGVAVYSRGVGPDGAENVALNIRTLDSVEPFSVKPGMCFDGRSRA